MKFKFLTLVLFLTATLSYAQIDSTKVAFVSYWELGDSYDFKISKIKKEWTEGNQTKDQHRDYIANFTVVDSTETSYTVHWTYENDLENTYNIPEELSERFSKYKLTTIKYKTSELGVLLEVLNWKEISQVMSSMFDDIVEVLAKGDEKTKLALKKKMDPLKAMYSTQQGIEQLVIKELHYFHFPMGLEYDITTPLTYQDELANMFGGKPIKGQVKLYFEDVDFDQGFCVLKQDMNLNPEDTKNLLKHVFKKMNLNDKKMKKALKTAVFKIEDRNVYEYYYNPGIPHRIETTRETVVNIDKENGRIIDKIIIELIYNDDEE